MYIYIEQTLKIILYFYFNIYILLLIVSCLYFTQVFSLRFSFLMSVHLLVNGVYFAAAASNYEYTLCNSQHAQSRRRMSWCNTVETFPTRNVAWSGVKGFGNTCVYYTRRGFPAESQSPVNNAWSSSSKQAMFQLLQLQQRRQQQAKQIRTVIR